MRAFFFWEPVGGLTLQHKCNPYAGLLAQELEKRDIHLELGEYDLQKTWLEENRRDFDVLHLHWLHYFYRRETLEESVTAYRHFAENLTYAKKVLGYRIVWTLHNVYPHERPFPELDHLARLLVCSLADAITAHCTYAADLGRRLFHISEEVHVIPHGNFIDAFPNAVSREAARARFGFSKQNFVYLFFGNARAYKGIEHLVRAFSAVQDTDARLLLMMRRAFNPEYADGVIQEAEQDSRVRVFTSAFFPESDFQYYLNAADVAVFPFSEVLTSGSAIAALSFGLPVILPRLGCLPELIDNRMGMLYDAKASEGLRDALLKIRELDIGRAREAARQRAEELNWSDIADQLAALYYAQEGWL
ncbi:MAG: glycosyltransferase [bacterium]|nr:glycosyltransferase [bacterium]